MNAASAHDRTSAGTIIQDFVARRDPGVCALEKKKCDFLVKEPLDFGGTLILPAPHKICDESAKGSVFPSVS